MFAEHLDIDHALVDMTKLDGAEQTLDTVDDLEPSAVAQREN
jgi:hypothetical protein